MRSANCLAESKPLGSTTARLPCTHLGSMGLSQGLCVGRNKGRIRTPLPEAFTRHGCVPGSRCARAYYNARRHYREISNQARFPWASSSVQQPARNCVVMSLTGRPSTKRKDIRSRMGQQPVLVATRPHNRPVLWHRDRPSATFARQSAPAPLGPARHALAAARSDSTRPRRGSQAPR